MLCKSCGEDNPPGARFCGSCGSAFAAVTELSTLTTASPPSQVGPTVTGEYARFWIRFAAFLVDGLIVNFTFLLIFSSIGTFRVYAPMAFTFSGLLGFLLSWVYFWLFTGLNRGQTPGKMLMRIRVVDARGSAPGLGCAAMRELLGRTVCYLVWFMGFLWVAWDRQKQGWHVCNKGMIGF